MSTPEEGFYAKLAGIAAVLGVLIAFLAWRYPQAPPPVAIPPGDFEQPLSPLSSNDDETADQLKPVPQPTTKIQPSVASNSEASTEFTLRDGEQKVLLSGQAAVSTQFNRLGEENFLTLRISIGDETTPHVVLAPGMRFTLRVQEAQYYLSLLSLDLSDRTARFRIDRAQ